MARSRRVVPLREAADVLGVPYQTAYGWVRQGVLPATKARRRYQVSVADLEALGARRDAGTPPRPEVRLRNWQPQADRFYDAIVAGDERLAQTRLERLAAGVAFIELCELVVAPAMRRVGDDWAFGEVTIAVEHRASAICERLIAPSRPDQPGAARAELP
jgi:MerR family transcriptional regulator, light-induced transcriptional regulator